MGVVAARSPWTALAFLVTAVPPALGLDPDKLLTQYTHSSWSQAQGLPQDSVHKIAQTSDGFLWIGTAEGLAKFDGYEFRTFDVEGGALPSNSITALAPAGGGGLWIGTPNGLTLHRDGRFRTYTTKDGLPDNAISAVDEGPDGTVWIAAGLFLSRYGSGRFTTYAPGRDIPLSSVRTLCRGRKGELWIAGLGGVATRSGEGFRRVVDPATLGGNIPYALLAARNGDLWIGGSEGLMVAAPDGRIRRFRMSDGLPDNSVRALAEDSDGNVWAGTGGGVARHGKGRFLAFSETEKRSRDIVFALFEDRERNVWAGTNSGLSRYRDDLFTVYGTSEGLPSDTPNSVFEDRAGRLWVGFHNSGLMLFEEGGHRSYTTRNGLPVNEILSIRQRANGELILGTAAGLVRKTQGGFATYRPPDALSRWTVFDALEDGKGRLWLATPGGLGELRGGKFHLAIPGGPLISSSFGVLAESHDGSIWAGTLGRGLWRWKEGAAKHFTAADGLSSNGIRSLFEDANGTLWIGTFGGGLSALRAGKFQSFRAKDGLPSDNVLHVTGDGIWLWLSTTRGICKVKEADLWDFAQGRRKDLPLQTFGVQDGLRSSQAGPSHPVAGGGTRSRDGRLWFPTSRGLAVLKANSRPRQTSPPVARILEATVDGEILKREGPVEIPPGKGRIQIRFAAIHLSAPERVQYSYRLEGLDHDWIAIGNRRVIDYSGLRPGHYRFAVRGSLPGATGTPAFFSFALLPRFYQTAWFYSVCAAAALASAALLHRWRLTNIRRGFQLVLAERARLAREIHDTLAQGFAGISSQLEAVAMCMPEHAEAARRHLLMARRMARHSLTEARRSVMDLRSSDLEGQDLASALRTGARSWTRNSPTRVEVDAIPPPGRLPHETGQHLLRIAQEAVVNAVKHSGASKIDVKLFPQNGSLFLQVTDNGAGFDTGNVLADFDGHFGLVGMRERAQRVRGVFRIQSSANQGTAVEVQVPLP